MQWQYSFYFHNETTSKKNMICYGNTQVSLVSFPFLGKFFLFVVSGWWSWWLRKTAKIKIKTSVELWRWLQRSIFDERKLYCYSVFVIIPCSYHIMLTMIYDWHSLYQRKIPNKYGTVWNIPLNIIN